MIWRRDGVRDIISFFDAAIITIGITALGLGISLRHILHNPYLDNPTKVLAVVNFICLAFVIMAAIRLLFTAGHKHMSYWLLVLSCVSIFTAMVIGGVEQSDPDSIWIHLGYALTILFLATSALVALHPSMLTVTTPGPIKPLWYPIWRFISVAGFGITPSILVLFPSVHVTDDGWIIGGLAILSYALVVTRSKLVVSGLRRTIRQIEFAVRD
jgi:hypothetical protein